MLLRKIIIAAMICFTATLLQAEDIAVHIDTETYQNKEAERNAAVIYISGEDVKVIREGSASYIIFKGDKDLIWFVNKDERKYTEIDKESLRKIKAGIEQMRKQLEQMPARQRAMAETMMKQRMKQFNVSQEGEEKDLESRLTAQTKEINSYPCRKIEILKDSAKIKDMWITEWDNIKYEDELKSAYTAMMDCIGSIRSILDEEGVQNYVQMPFVRCNFRGQLEGMPVSVIHYEDSQVVNKNTLRKIEPADLADSAFRPPAGYQREQPEFPE